MKGMKGKGPAKKGKGPTLAEVKKRAEERRLELEAIERKKIEEEEARKRKLEEEEAARKAAEEAERIRKIKEEEAYHAAEARKEAISKEEAALRKKLLEEETAEKNRLADEAYRERERQRRLNKLRKEEKAKESKEKEEEKGDTLVKVGKFDKIDWDGSESDDSNSSDSESEDSDIYSGDASQDGSKLPTKPKKHAPKHSSARVAKQPEVPTDSDSKPEPSFRAPITTVLGHVDAGKCFAPGTEVMMADGTITVVEKIKPGDRLLGPDSKPRIVSSVTSGHDEMYRVTPMSDAFNPFAVNGPHVLVFSISCTPQIRVMQITESKCTCAIDYFVSVPRPEEAEMREDAQEDCTHIPKMKEILVEGPTETEALIAAHKMAREIYKGEIDDQALRGRVVFQVEMRDFFDLPPKVRRYARLFAPNRYTASLEPSKPVTAEDMTGSPEGGVWTKKMILSGLSSKNKRESEAALVAVLSMPLPERIAFITEMGIHNTIWIQHLCSSIGRRVGPGLMDSACGNYDECYFRVDFLGCGKYYGFCLTPDSDSLFMLGDGIVVHNTKILDRIRSSNVQAKEAGLITQQIGATFLPRDFLLSKVTGLPYKLQLDIPGLLMIDTPGHESFANLRSRGSSLCDIAILVVDILSGLENQTIESLSLLRARHTPFIIALNKIDRLTLWAPKIGPDVQTSSSADLIKSLKGNTLQHFNDRWSSIQGDLGRRGISAELFWKNKDQKRCVNVIPTSAMTGEGIGDLIAVLSQLSQRFIGERIKEKHDEFQCSALEVKVAEGYGTTVDAILVNGTLRKGDRIVMCGIDEPIITTVKALLTPQPATESRIKGEYIVHDEIKAAIGLKIVALGMEKALAGSSIILVKPGDDEEALAEEVMADVDKITERFGLKDEGVHAQASTLGSLEALLSFLSDEKIPVASFGLGPIFKSHVRRASLQQEKGNPELAIILGFDVQIDADARKEATEMDIRIFTADVIYTLQKVFVEHLEAERIRKRKEKAALMVYPCVLKYLPGHSFHLSDPIIIGIKVEQGTLYVNTPLMVTPNDPKDPLIQLGIVESIQKDKKPADMARSGEEVSIRIKPARDSLMATRHFQEGATIYSKISRVSLDVAKEHFPESLESKEIRRLVMELKAILSVQ